jgi:hypothetical protein
VMPGAPAICQLNMVKKSMESDIRQRQVNVLSGPC